MADLRNVLFVYMIGLMLLDTTFLEYVNKGPDYHDVH